MCHFSQQFLNYVIYFGKCELFIFLPNFNLCKIKCIFRYYVKIDMFTVQVIVNNRNFTLVSTFNIRGVMHSCAQGMRM